MVPQFILRAHDSIQEQPNGPINFPIQGKGTETRSFVYIDDFTEGLALAIEKGKHQEIYHVGTEEELTIAKVAKKIVTAFGREINLEPGPLTQGSAACRCPDISKIKKLGYQPKYNFEEALGPSIDWYIKHAKERPN